MGVILRVLLKSVDKIGLIKIGQNTRHFTRRSKYVYDNIYANYNGDIKRLKQVLSDKDNTKLTSNIFFLNIVFLLNNYEKYDGAKQTTHPIRDIPFCLSQLN